MSLTPTQLSLRMLRNDGWHAEVVERWNPHARIRQDLWDFVDILALRGPDTLAVQTTTASHMAARVRKIADAEALPWLREAGWGIVVHGWKKDGARWACRTVDVS